MSFAVVRQWYENEHEAVSLSHWPSVHQGVLGRLVDMPGSQLMDFLCVFSCKCV